MMGNGLLHSGNKKIPIANAIGISSSGVGRGRTADTRIFSPVLYQLSYRTVLSGCKYTSFRSNSKPDIDFLYSPLKRLAPLS